LSASVQTLPQRYAVDIDTNNPFSTLVFHLGTKFTFSIPSLYESKYDYISQSPIPTVEANIPVSFLYGKKIIFVKNKNKNKIKL
jgi:hypothetical protein